MSTPIDPRSNEEQEDTRASSEYLEATRLLEATLVLKAVLENPKISLEDIKAKIRDEVDRKVAEAINAHGPGLKAASQDVQAGARKALEWVNAAVKEGLQEVGSVLTPLVHELTENPRGDHAEALRRASSSINEACQKFVEKARECLKSNLMGPLSNLLNNLVKLANKVSTLVTTAAPILSAFRSKEVKPTEAADVETKEKEEYDDTPRRDGPG